MVNSLFHLVLPVEPCLSVGGSFLVRVSEFNYILDITARWCSAMSKLYGIAAGAEFADKECILVSWWFDSLNALWDRGCIRCCSKTGRQEQPGNSRAHLMRSEEEHVTVCRTTTGSSVWIHARHCSPRCFASLHNIPAGLHRLLWNFCVGISINVFQFCMVKSFSHSLLWTCEAPQRP